MTLGSWVGEAANVLTPVNISRVFKATDFSKVRPTFEAAIVILVGAGGRCRIGKRLFLHKDSP